jgi:hypothetical protein
MKMKKTITIIMLAAAMIGTAQSADDLLSDWAKLVIGESVIGNSKSGHQEITPDELTATVEGNWEKGGFGTVAIWHVTFTNNSDFPISTIRYTTKYAAENGDIVGHGGGDDHIIRKVINPHSSRTLEINDGFISPAADKASFHLVDWQHAN